MNTPNPTNHKFPAFFERLEDRVLFDGVPDAAFILPVEDVSSTVPAQVVDINATRSMETTARELIIVDAGVEDGAELVQALIESKRESTFEIRFLQSDVDGVEQITDLLSQTNASYSAIHIVSHGQAGSVALGSSVLDSESINQYKSQLALWGNALTEDADLLFYGCELAGNEAGQSLLETVSAATGADVAASVDLTGSTAADGNWSLSLIHI